MRPFKQQSSCATLLASAALLLCAPLHAASFKADATVMATQSTLACQTQDLFKKALAYGDSGERRQLNAMFDAKECVVVQNGSKFKVRSVAGASLELVPVGGATAIWADPEYFAPQ
jgi:hypothetical protein